MMRKYPPSVTSSRSSEITAPLNVRRFARAAVDLPAQYAIEGEPVWRTSIIDDLGGGGVRLQTGEDVAAGTVVALRFEVDGTPVNATARIAMSLYDRSRSCYVHGAAFTAIDPRQRDAIVERVGALQSSNSPPKDAS